MREAGLREEPRAWGPGCPAQVLIERPHPRGLVGCEPEAGSRMGRAGEAGGGRGPEEAEASLQTDGPGTPRAGEAPGARPRTGRGALSGRTHFPSRAEDGRGRRGLRRKPRREPEEHAEEEPGWRGAC